MPFSAKPFSRSRHESHSPQASPGRARVVATARQPVVDAEFDAAAR